ncbi:MAG: transcription-repair coupling factor [Planctomycetaceae bacterium]|nr:transcription-repair coupling factor [Planctomycetaceae bacterium]
MESCQVDTASRPLTDLARRLETYAGFSAAVAELQAGRSAVFDGVVGASCALLAAGLLQQAPGPLVIVCRSDDVADLVADDLKMFAGGSPQRLPAGDMAIGERSLQDDTYGLRLRALKHLEQWHARPPEPVATDNGLLERVVVTSMPSLMQRVPQRQVVAACTRRLATGDALDGEELRAWLVANRYHATTAVQLPGEFAARGGIVDVFAADWDRPVRLELLGDQLESIRRFDLESQRSIETLQAIEITALRPDAHRTALLTDYLTPSTWVLLIEPDQALAEAARQFAHLGSPDGVASPDAVTRALWQFPLALAGSVAPAGPGPTCRLPIESVERFSGDIARVREELDRSAADHEVYLIARMEAELQRLEEIFATTQLAQSGRLHLVVGTLYEGFRLVAERLVLISGAELFQRGELRRVPRRRLGKAIDSFLELREGDLVVHLAHGIGRYRGLRKIEKHGRVEEHLVIEFHANARIYVPAQRIGLVQKYVGGTKSRPALARIGGKTWVRQKAAAEAAVVDLACEMLEIQAARRARPGIAFAADSEWQQAFDTSFPYTETADQLASIEAIKHDMHQPRPMDRLLCGDVGFGKTEVAMRAAFKAVDSGYQVAVLVPTTILAEQHFQTFRQRMAEFPFDIARLSRFCTPQEQREIVEGLATGRIDIVIGTHRLASKDIRLYNLGLVIIDEEQRFGVEVKERLKRLRSTVDVLTMTATPIPRTLHMSLVGVRDISNLETPPEDRLAVETQVTRFDPGLIRHAVLRELNRNGQIYFVHNRVEDIEKLAKRLQFIVPEASLRIAHGQMPETELERVMVDFVQHQFDILLATTIVESGLDIPNANTIFVDEANRYGLADLHQLRGRVGRYKHRAYCYLLLDPRTQLTPNAARRLRAIEEFSDMGAGFAIAMRDLEIRGAGNLLGTQQSGHIATVGYELYCQLLEAAVRRLKQLPPSVSLDVHINLPGEALFPAEYVPDLRAKIDLYRRLAQITDVNQLHEYRQELVDRFGSPPAPVERLLELAELRIDAAIWQVSAIYVEDIYLVFRYENRARVEQLARLGGGRLRIVDKQHAYLPAEQAVADADQILHLAKSVLRPAR